MRDIEAVKMRLRRASDNSCNQAYMNGFRLGEHWAEFDATVVELTHYGVVYESMQERHIHIEDDVKEGQSTITMENLYDYAFVGVVFRRHTLITRFGYRGDALLHFEQGFVDAVRILCREAFHVLRARTEKYLAKLEKIESGRRKKSDQQRVR